MSDLEENTDNFESANEGLRHRAPWDGDGDKASISSSIPSLQEDKVELLETDDVSLFAEDVIGCPLPSTPVDQSSLDDEDFANNDGLEVMNQLASEAVEQAEEFVRKVWKASWNVCHFQNLPLWLQDNDFLHTGHRPPLYSFKECFKSIFRVHTETGNIWTHLLGCIAFIGISTYFLYNVDIEFQEKLVFGAFFLGAITCLGLSFAFHTLHCHSEHVGRLFSKLDYCGIALLIMGSFVPWLYYGFYCNFLSKVVYLTCIVVLGISCFIVSLWPKFSEPSFRPLRAGVFMSFGLSGVVPAMHYGYIEGWFSKVAQASLGWLLLMGVLYIVGGLLYALRIPERYFPGKCDYMFQSHQIFHVLVVSAAFVHYHGITEMAMYRLSSGGCEAPKPVSL